MIYYAKKTYYGLATQLRHMRLELNAIGSNATQSAPITLSIGVWIISACVSAILGPGAMRISISTTTSFNENVSIFPSITC
jgi:hypothetical protein